MVHNSPTPIEEEEKHLNRKLNLRKCILHLIVGNDIATVIAPATSIVLQISVKYSLQDQESGEDDDPEEFSESSLCIVGIRETRDVCACHEVLGIVSKDNTC